MNLIKNYPAALTARIVLEVAMLLIFAHCVAHVKHLSARMEVPKVDSSALPPWIT